MKRNVGPNERYARLLLGLSAGAAALLTRRRWASALLGAAAASGIETGLARYCPLNEALGIDNAGGSPGGAPRLHLPRSGERAISLKREIEGTVGKVAEEITQELKKEGFGVLTRIDLQSKIREKTGKEIAPALILGACNPELAYDAYVTDPDVAGVLPCNVVVREVSPGRVSVEIARPTSLMETLHNAALDALARGAEERLGRVMENFHAKTIAA